MGKLNGIQLINNKKIFDYINNKKLEKLESVLDFGDQDLNISFEDMVNNLKKIRLISQKKNLKL